MTTWRSQPLASAVVLGALVATAVGCGTGRATYHAVVPRIAQAGGWRAEIIDLDLPNIPDATRVGVTLRAPPELAAPALVDARLTRGAPGPRVCASGPRPEVLTLDGAKRLDRPVALTPGVSHRIRFGYGTSEPLDDPGGTAVEIVVESAPGRRECLRLPLTGDEPPLAWRSWGAWALGGALRLDGTLYGIARFGRWVGPVRGGVEAGVGFTDCLVSCVAKEPLVRARRNFPSAVTLAVFPLQLGAFALGLEGAFEMFWRSEGPGPAGAVRATLRLAVVPPRRHGLPRGAHMGFASVDFAYRYWVTSTGTEDSGLVQMVGVTWDFGL